MDKVVGESCFYGQKTFDIFKRLGRNEPFLGKNVVKKRNTMPIRGKLRNFFPISLGKAWESLKTRKWARGQWGYLR